jgi:heme exporter protein B
MTTAVREKPEVRTREPGWLSEAWAVFLKDVRSEVRTPAAGATILLFAVVSLVIVSFLLDTRTAGMLREGLDTVGRSKLLAALLWIVLFFSAIVGLPRTWVKEEEARTATALRLAATPIAVFLGKLLFNVVLVCGVALIILPLFIIFFTPVVKQWPLFLLTLIAGAVAMAGSSTILGAIVAQAGGKSYLMLPLAVPIVLPILVFTINGSASAMQGNPGNHVVGLVSYTVAMVTVSLMLFDRVWSD